MGGIITPKQSSFLLPCSFSASLEEVTTQQSVEQHGIHHHDGRQADTPGGIERQWHPRLVQHQPAHHPGQRANAEDHVGAQVEHAVQAAQGTREGGPARHVQQLPHMQEHGVDLHQQGHHSVAHKLMGQD